MNRTGSRKEPGWLFLHVLGHAGGQSAHALTAQRPVPTPAPQGNSARVRQPPAFHCSNHRESGELCVNSPSWRRGEAPSYNARLIALEIRRCAESPESQAHRARITGGRCDDRDAIDGDNTPKERANRAALASSRTNQEATRLRRRCIPDLSGLMFGSERCLRYRRPKCLRPTADLV